MKYWIFSALILLSMICPAFSHSKPFLIYFQGQPFYGDYQIAGHEIYVDQKEAVSELGLPANEIFPPSMVKIRQRKPYLSLSFLARRAHAFLQINWETRIVDFFTPVSGDLGGPIVVVPPSQVSDVSGAPNPYPTVSYPPIYPYPYDYPYIYYPMVLPQMSINPHVHWSNGILPEDDQGHVVPWFR